MSQSRERHSTIQPLHRILREVYRHYLEFRDLVSTSGESIIEYGYEVENEDGSITKVPVTISFWDLHWGLKDLAPRKREAFFHNVILDKRQKDVAEIMGITTVSVGQYVEAACEALAERYFAEEESAITVKTKNGILEKPGR